MAYYVHRPDDPIHTHIVPKGDNVTNVNHYYYCYYYCYCYCYFIWWSPFIPSMNLYEVSLITIYDSNVPSKPLSYYGIHGFNESRSFIYIHTIIYYIHNYIRSFLNIILRPILMVRMRLELASYCLCV